MNRKQILSTLKSIAILAGLLVATLLIISAVEQKQVSSIDEVNIHIDPLGSDIYLIDSADVRKTILRSFGFNLEAQKLATVDIARLERVLEDDPFILDADVFVTANNKVHIELRQREPILRIIDNEGLQYYLDKDGMRMPLSKHFSARLLVATGNIPPHTPDFLERKKHLLKDLFHLCNDIRENDFLFALVEQIHVQNGRFYLIPKIGNQKIIFGKYEEVADKFKRLKVFYDEAMPRMGWNRYKTIDLSFKGQVVCEK